MTSNDQILLERILEERQKESAAALSTDDHFRMFAFEQSLKEHDPSYDEIESGDIDAGDDGGIDGFFMFVNDEMIQEPINPELYRKGPRVELVLVQSKNTASFKESPLEKVAASAAHLFALDKDVEEFTHEFNERLIERIRLFRDSYLGLAHLQPTLSVTFAYVSKGSTSGIHPKVRSKADHLLEVLGSLLHGAVIKLVFYGARELLDLARAEKTYTLQLRFKELLTAQQGEAYVILTGLDEYLNFITDETKQLRRYVFDSNVRDFQGEVEVNKEIRKSLDSEDELDFWWLNNGITILASSATIAGKQVTLDNVQIVNGLQTTETIFRSLNPDSEGSRWRSILVKILISEDTEARDRIIKATNFQTKIPDSSLRATDSVQRNIEQYFGIHGFYYDRRKNFYKNAGKPASRIVGIPYLAQSFGAVVLREPHLARGRPSSLIKKDEDYVRIFREEVELELYLSCVKIMRSVNAFLKTRTEQYSTEARTNLRYHLGMVALMMASKILTYTEGHVISAAKRGLDDEQLDDAMGALTSLLEEYRKTTSATVNAIAKQREFVKYVTDGLEL